MPVKCYRVTDYRELPGGEALARTHALAPRNTNLSELLRLAAPSSVEIARPSSYPRRSRTIGDLAGESWTTYYRVAPRELRAALALLESHNSPVVTAINTECRISVCLDFHHVVQNDVPPEKWKRTEAGDLVWKAKYHQNRAAILECRRTAVAYVKGHPVLNQLTGVAAMPGSRIGVPSPLPTLIAKAISDEFGVPIVDLSRSRQAKPQKKLTPDDDPEANQRDSMSASIRTSPGFIVVVDDLMRDGSSVREASRALRAAGAVAIGSVSLVKNIRGTRKYVFD